MVKGNSTGFGLQAYAGLETLLVNHVIWIYNRYLQHIWPDLLRTKLGNKALHLQDC